MGSVEKARDFKGTWREIIQYCRSYLPAIMAAFVLAIIGAVLQIIGPDKIKDLTNEVIKGLPTIIGGQIALGAIDFDAVTSIAVLLVFFYSASALLSFVENYIMATVTAKISKNMRTGISQKINKLPFKYFDKTSHGDVISRVTNDVDTIGQTMNQNLDNLVRAVTLFVGSLFMMFYNSWVLALTAVVSAVIGFLLMMLIMSKSRKHFRAQQQGLGNIDGHIEEIYSGHNVVKAYNGGKEARKTFEGFNEALYESGWKSQFLSGLMMPIMHFVGNLGYVSVCVVGAALVMLDEPLTVLGFVKINPISFGVIVAFMIYIRFFAQALSQLAQSMQVLQRTAAAGERVFEFFGEEELAEENNKKRRIGNISGNVEFKHVHFGYEKEKTIIHDFSAKIKAGQKIAIVGPTGAGKTTIVNLLMRFYEIESGEILLDGVPISEVTRENVHEQFCMVLQDTWLFEGTIKENIIYSKQGVSDEDVVAACKAAGLHHFIKTLPDGYNTVLDDKASLSEGQKQLLTIARAMIQNAPLLILDEATSSVDTRTEVLVQRAMDKLTKGRTSFVIAHRLSTIKNADMILVMNAGDIVESGSHDELIALDGVYAALYNSQFEQAS
jgi:ATP-binding cassette subfamily B protein